MMGKVKKEEKRWRIIKVYARKDNFEKILERLGK